LDRWQDVGDIAIRLEKAQGEETLWTTTKPVVIPFEVSGGSGFVKNTGVTCFGCGRPGHIQKRCPYKTSKSTKKAVTNARSSFANPRANRSEDRKCYLCNRPGHIARDCPQQSKILGDRTAQQKGKSWCSYHKLNTHSSEAGWALHPELTRSSKEKVAHSARPARVVPAKAGHNLNVKLRPTALSTEKTTQPDVIQTMDSYYAKEMFDGDANDLAGLFITAADAATKKRRSAETQGLRRVTQADLPLSFLPHSNVPAATERPVPDPVPTPVVIVDELGPFTPRQLYRAPRVGKVYGGKDMISEDLLDATDPDHDPSNKSDSLEMPEGFGYLSEGDPNFQGVLEFVMPRRLQAKRSMLRNGSGENEEEESAVPIRSLGESEMPQEGHPLDPLRDEAARQVLKNLPPGEQPSLMNGKELAKDIPADVLTRDDFSSGTSNVRRNDPPEEAAVVGEKRSGGKSTSPLGQQSTFDKSMQGTPFTTVVQEDPDVEPILYAPMNGRADHIRDQAPENWTIHDRQKYHQIELQALLGRPMPADTSR
jgi:hypothetical protein